MSGWNPCNSCDPCTPKPDYHSLVRKICEVDQDLRHVRCVELKDLKKEIEMMRCVLGHLATPYQIARCRFITRS